MESLYNMQTIYLVWQTINQPIRSPPDGREARADGWGEEPRGKRSRRRPRRDSDGSRRGGGAGVRVVVPGGHRGRGHSAAGRGPAGGGAGGASTVARGKSGNRRKRVLLETSEIQPYDIFGMETIVRNMLDASAHVSDDHFKRHSWDERELVYEMNVAVKRGEVHAEVVSISLSNFIKHVMHDAKARGAILSVYREKQASVERAQQDLQEQETEKSDHMDILDLTSPKYIRRRQAAKDASVAIATRVVAGPCLLLALWYGLALWCGLFGAANREAACLLRLCPYAPPAVLPESRPRSGQVAAAWRSATRSGRPRILGDVQRKSRPAAR